MKAGLGVLAVALLALAGPASADPDPVQGAKNAVVIVVAKGIDTAHGNIEVSTRGSGFFINKEGILVTANHLRSMLGQGVDEASVTYQVFLKTHTLPIEAQFVTANASADMLILYAPGQDSDFGILRPVFRSSGDLVPNSTRLIALGYPNGFGYTPQPGVLTGWQGAISPVQIGWTTDTKFNDGMSGGPVITQDGRVAAIVKGVDQGIGLVIPVAYVPNEYWERESAKPAITPAGLEGGARLVVTRQRQSARARDGGQAVSLTRSPCDPGATVSIPIVPTPGWSVVDASARFKLKQFSGESVETDFVSGAGGWTLEVRLAPGGTCGPNGAVVGDSAKLEGTIAFREVPSGPGGEEVIAESASAGGAKLAIGPSAQGLIYRLERSDGTSEIIAPRRTDFRNVNGVLTIDAARLTARANR